MENADERQQDTPAQECTALAVTGHSCDRSDLKSLFAEWLALPNELRYPKTQKEFGAKYGVHQNTLSEWKFSDEVQAQVNTLVRRHANLRFGQYMEYLEREAERGNVKAIELYLKVVQGYRERFDIAARHDHSGQIDVLVDGKPAPQLPVGLVRTANASEMRN